MSPLDHGWGRVTFYAPGVLYWNSWGLRSMSLDLASHSLVNSAPRATALPDSLPHRTSVLLACTCVDIEAADAPLAGSVSRGEFHAVLATLPMDQIILLHCRCLGQPCAWAVLAALRGAGYSSVAIAPSRLSDQRQARPNITRPVFPHTPLAGAVLLES